MKVAIIGCGLIGEKRARHLAGAKLELCVDTIAEKANQLAKKYGSEASTNWQTAVNHPEINIIIVATPHAFLSEIAVAALQKNKHVLLEKPGGKRSIDLEPLHLHAKHSFIRIGFNHRYHRAFQKARELVDQDALGELMYIRARYGHGGRLGYENEWRASPQISGGGELIDQGIHLIDLARWFLGDFSEVQGHANTYYWNMPVEDNGFLLLKTPKKQVAFLHASCTEWKNLFSFEIYGHKGKIDIQGLGGSYGTERITFYKMSPTMGPPETFIWEYPMTDNSWEVEFAEFLEDIQLNRHPKASVHDAEAALRIVEEIYRISAI